MLRDSAWYEFELADSITKTTRESVSAIRKAVESLKGFKSDCNSQLVRPVHDCDAQIVRPARRRAAAPVRSVDAPSTSLIVLGTGLAGCQVSPSSSSVSPLKPMMPEP